MMSDKPTADEMAKMIDTAIARAEAAENDSRAWEALAARAEAIVMVQQDKIAELEAQLAATWRPVTARELGKWSDDRLRRELDVSFSRITELEAQLAATWRPVTEPPMEEGLYLVWNGKEFSLRSYMTFDLGTGEVYGPMWGDDYLYDAPITHWRPLPPPPSGE